MLRLSGKALKLAIMFSFLIMGFYTSAAEQAPEAIPGEFVVKLKKEFSVENKEKLKSDLGSYIKSTIPQFNLVVIKRPVFELKTSVINTLSKNPMVQFVEPNYIYKINKTPNDPLLPQLWGMKNIGQQDSANRSGIAGVDIGAEQAWDIETGSKDVIVAVIDTGINYNSEDLKNNLWINEAEANGKPGVDDDNNGIFDDIHGAAFVQGKESGDPLDDHGHGSHCSGTIGASGNDGKGLVGVSWNVRLMGVKFLDANGSGSLEDAVRAIDYATKMGAKIMSNSWGGGGFSEALKDVIEKANTSGALFVAAAGNESNNNDENPTYPASYEVPNVLSVAAIDNKGQVASFSNNGQKNVHIAAPGVNILSTTTNGYQSWSGTSMATPHVSGVAALLVAHEARLNNIEIKNRLIATAKGYPQLRTKVKSGGVVNAYNSLTNQPAPPDPNDPANWNKANSTVSSSHPYKNKSSETYNVKVNGAKEIALYFSKFDTEANYDFVEIYDGKGNLVDKLSGVLDDSYSAVISGDSAKIILKSDDSLTKYGFDITHAAWR